MFAESPRLKQGACLLITELDQQRIAVERKIDELKQFEKEYRSHLKQYLETQLYDLNSSGQDSAKNI